MIKLDFFPKEHVQTLILKKIENTTHLLLLRRQFPISVISEVLDYE